MKRIFRDPLMTHPAVLAYRDAMNFCPNSGFRRDIAATVRDLDLWKDLLANWRYKVKGKWKGKNPLAIKDMLTTYEQRMEDRNGAGKTGTLPTCSSERFSPRSDSHLHAMPDKSGGVYFRPG